MQSQVFTDASAALAFALAGNATLTLSSQRTGARYTFRARKPQEGKDDPVRFVSLLTGSNNTTDYTYVGMIKEGRLVPTAKSKLKVDSLPILAFNYFLDHAHAGHIGPKLEVRHEGSCGRCGRKLTVPESVDTGFGPECVKLVAKATH